MEENTDLGQTIRLAEVSANLLDLVLQGVPYILLVAEPSQAGTKRDTIIMSRLPRESVEAILAEVGTRLPDEGRDASAELVLEQNQRKH